MKKLIAPIILSILSVPAFATPLSCRYAVVEAYASMKVIVEPYSFSSLTFTELNLTAAQINDLDVLEQVNIYNQLKPMTISIENAIGSLNYNIRKISGTAYEFLLLDQLIDMRAKRDQLRSCVKKNS